MSDILHLELNQPQTIALVATQSLPIFSKFGQPQEIFALVGNKRFYASPEVADKIRALGVRANESFAIKKWKQGRNVKYDVWLSPSSEKQRAEEESPQVAQFLRGHADAGLLPHQQRRDDASTLTSEASVKTGDSRERPASVHLATAADVRAALAPTGTEGPAPLPKIVPAATPVPPKREGPKVIPFNVAFREVVAFVKAELEDCKEQWNDEARQGAISTILIAANNRGWLGPWERE